ncbi:hypothetical protein NMG60_11000157 [Bertholletia excelsa]
MNPQRPNCLKNDYVKGCKVLREAYSSLFEGFISILRSQQTVHSEKTDTGWSLPSPMDFETSHTNQPSISDQKVKREVVYESERNKKCKGLQELPRSNTICMPDGKEISRNEKNNRSTSKAWAPWAQALYDVAMHPEKHKNDVLEILDDIVVLHDIYPKAKRHILVLARLEGLEHLADAHKEHIDLLRKMHTVGLKWAEKCTSEDETLIFRIGYHSAPSMRQLHLHVISQDFDSKHLKNKKHWNSFTTPFFRDSVDVLEEIQRQGRAILKDDDSFMSMELRCHRCRSAHPNIPRLKSHIGKCQASFPAPLLQNGRLVLAPDKNSNNQ